MTTAKVLSGLPELGGQGASRTKAAWHVFGVGDLFKKNEFSMGLGGTFLTCSIGFYSFLWYFSKIFCGFLGVTPGLRTEGVICGFLIKYFKGLLGFQTFFLKLDVFTSDMFGLDLA